MKLAFCFGVYVIAAIDLRCRNPDQQNMVWIWSIQPHEYINEQRMIFILFTYAH